MKPVVMVTRPWSLTGQTMAKDVRRELQNQLTAMSTVSQWVLFPVISLCLWGLWTELAIEPLLTWAVLAYIASTYGSLPVRMPPTSLSSPAISATIF